jgi:hypothetical protein
MAYDFKTGDRVRYIGETTPEFTGREGMFMCFDSLNSTFHTEDESCFVIFDGHPSANKQTDRIPATSWGVFVKNLVLIDGKASVWNNLV